LRFCQKIIFVPTVWSKVLFFLHLVTLGYERGSKKKMIKKKKKVGKWLFLNDEIYHS